MPSVSVESTDWLTACLLVEIEVRGTDATGFAYTTPNKQLMVNKWAEKASDVVGMRYDKLPRVARSAVLHTRLATQGSKDRRANNHPIVQGGIVGVHNGVIMNDDEIFADLGCVRNGEVDSEAIFAALWAAHVNGQAPADALPRPEGRMAIAWLNTGRGEGNPEAARDTLHIARGSESPLCVAQTAGGSFIFASTKAILMDAVSLAEIADHIVWMDNVDEGTYMRVVRGTIVEVDHFRPSPGSWLTSYYRGTSGWSFKASRADQGQSYAESKGYDAEVYARLWEEEAERDSVLGRVVYDDHDVAAVVPMLSAGKK